MFRLLAKSKLKMCVSKLCNWMCNNRLKLNGDKTYGYHFDLPVFKVDNHIASPVTEACNLGVIFDSKISIEVHIATVCQSCYLHLCDIGSICNLITQSACEKLVPALIFFRLDIGSALMYG